MNNDILLAILIALLVTCIALFIGMYVLARVTHKSNFLWQAPDDTKDDEDDYYE